MSSQNGKNSPSKTYPAYIPYVVKRRREFERYKNISIESESPDDLM